MQSIKIYSPEGGLVTEVTPDKNCLRRFSLMQQDCVVLKFRDREALRFPVGSRISIGEDDFFITVPQPGKWEAATGVWLYELTFEAYYRAWANKMLRYVTPGVDSAAETSFALTATIDVHAAMLKNCLDWLGQSHGGSPFRVQTDESVAGGEAKLVTYENVSVLGGLQAIAEAFECEWWVEGSAVCFGRMERERADLRFEAGVNVSTITFQASSTAAPNRLYVFGSDRNLPPDYRATDAADTIGGVVNRRLMLPAGTPYLQTTPDLPEEEVVEGVVVLEDVYPRTGLTVTEEPEVYEAEAEQADGSMVRESFYRLSYGAGFRFSAAYLLPDEELHIVFRSGLLNGMDFGARFNPKGLNEKNADGSWNDAAQMIEVVANEDYGRKLPDAVLRPQKGDEFILYGWDATKMADLGLVADAEQELLEEGRKALEEYSKDLSSCTCPMAWDYIKALTAEGRQPRPGDSVTIIDTEHFGSEGRKSRIIGYEYPLDKPYAATTYTCGEAVSERRLDSMERKIEGLARSGQKVQIQNSLDFLSKRYADRTPYRLSSDTAFEAGNYVGGVSGGILGIDKGTGKSFAEVDDLWVRCKAYFESLTVIESETLAGRQYITPGGSVKCVAVRDASGRVKHEAVVAVDSKGNELPSLTSRDAVAYRCYYLEEQAGEKSVTKIIKGDQAISRTFNVPVGSTGQVTNHYWWRLVTDVANAAYTDIDTGNVYGYIEVSASVCDGASGSFSESGITYCDIPAEGDVIAQLGSRAEGDVIAQLGSRAEGKPERQSAIVLDTVGSDAPSIKLFQGINDFTLADHDVVSFGYNPTTGKADMRVYGDTYIGDRDGGAFMKFDEIAKQLSIKGKIVATSPIVDEKGEDTGKTVGELKSDLESQQEEIAKAQEWIKKNASELDALEGTLASYDYIKAAIKNGATTTNGGLLLSSLIKVGSWLSTDPANPVMEAVLAGMNGIYNSKALGGGIASWWGGDMIDRFDINGNLISPAPANAATALVRMDGTAYFLGGNILFNKDGSARFGDAEHGLEITKDGGLVLGSGVKIMVGSDVQGLNESLSSLAEFNAGLTRFLVPWGYTDEDEDTTPHELTWQDAALESTHVLGLKTKEVGFFSETFLSARGASTGTSGGSGSGGSGYGLYTDFTWESAPLATDALSAKLGKDLRKLILGIDASVTTSIGGITERVKTAEGNLSDLQNSLTVLQSSLGNYVKKAGDVMTGALTATSFIKSGGTSAQFLKADGSVDSSTYLTTHQKIYALTFQAGTFSAKTFTANSAAATVNIPTTTSHISEGTNKYYTDARVTAAMAPTVAIINAAIDKKLDITTFNEFKDLFDSMFVKESDGNGGYRIKAKFGLYTQQFLSTRGLSTASGGTGTGSGYGLYTDKTWATTILATDALAASVGKVLRDDLTVLTTRVGTAEGSLTSLQSSLNTATGDITTLQNSLGNYVKKAGDTMTGALTIQGGADNKLIFNNTDTDNCSFISFRQNGTAYSSIQAWSTRFQFSLYLQAPRFISTVGNGTAPLQVSSTTAVTNLNADMVDGYHVGSALNRIPIWTDFPAHSVLKEKGYLPADFNATTEPTNERYFKALLQWATATYSGAVLLMGKATPNSQGFLHLSIYSTALQQNGLPQHSYAVFHKYGGEVQCFGTMNYVWKWNYATFHGSLSGNASTATQLQTARTLWGQSFNGTANVSGGLTGVGTIIPAANLTYNLGSSTLMFNRTYTRYLDTQSGYALRIATGGVERMIVGSAGNVGIGTTEPSHLLHVNGEALVNSTLWLKNTNTGILNSGNQLVFKAWDGVSRVVISNTEMRRSADYTAGAYNLGTTTYRWGNLYAMGADFTGTSSSVNINNGVLTVGSTLNANGVVNAKSTLNVTGVTNANGGIIIPAAKTLKIGDATISWDSAAGALKVDRPLYSTNTVSARGISTASGSGSGTGSGYGLYTDSTWASDPLATDALAASLGVVLHSDIVSLQSAVADRYTKAQSDGLYQPKGNYLTAHQSLANYVTLNTAQNISGIKTFKVRIDLSNDLDAMIRVIGKASGGQAAGIHYYNNAASTRVAGIGYYANMVNGEPTAPTNMTSPILFMGWGSSPWNPANNLSVGDGQFTYKNNNVLHVGNYAATLDNRYVKKAGDTMTGTLTITNNSSLVIQHPDTTGGTAKSVYFKDSDGTNTYIFGSLLSNHVKQHAYIGWGTAPWNESDCFAVSESKLKYKGQNVLHAGNTALATSGNYLVWTKGGTATNITVPYATLAASANKLNRNATPQTGYELTYYAGQPTKVTDPASTTVGAAYAGSSAKPNLWSFPAGKTGLGTTTANVMAIRLGWSSTYFHDLFASPNYEGLWYRAVTNGTARDWHQLAYIDSTVAAAEKLATAHTINQTAFDGTAGIITAIWGVSRKLWGRSCNGGADVSGTLENVASIVMAGSITGVTTLSMNSDLTYPRDIKMKRNLMLLADGAPNGYYIANDTSGRLAIYTMNTSWGWVKDVAAFDANGNFGLGTKSPAYRLDVIGETRITGATHIVGATDITAASAALLLKTGGTHVTGLPAGLSTNGALNVQLATTSSTLLLGAYDNTASPTSSTRRFMMDYAVGSNLLYLRWGGSVAAYFSSSSTRLYGSLIIGPSTGAATLSYNTAAAGLCCSTGFYTSKYLSSRGIDTDSDARLKTRIAGIALSIRDIARAPLWLFRWNDTGEQDSGSVAQYWERILPHVVRERDHKTLDYGKAALISVVTAAREIARHDQEIEQLRQENRQLRHRIAKLEVGPVRPV